MCEAWTTWPQSSTNFCRLDADPHITPVPSGPGHAVPSTNTGGVECVGLQGTQQIPPYGPATWWLSFTVRAETAFPGRPTRSLEWWSLECETELGKSIMSSRVDNCRGGGPREPPLDARDRPCDAVMTPEMR